MGVGHAQGVSNYGLFYQAVIVYMRRISVALILLCCLCLLNACSEGGYLLQCVNGQWALMTRAKPIDSLLADDNVSEDLREQLKKVLGMREFAVDVLGLPDNGSYKKYVDLERPYAVWNMVAAPEFSLELQQWCFPIIGCVTYRGYFDEATALAAAEKFSLQGFDVDVYGVQAYSTLSWFDDPVLNTFIHADDLRLASLLFHEMAHQVVYVPDDTVFNESFAKTVELEGLRRWLDFTGSAELDQSFRQREGLSADFQNFLATTRDELARIYDSELNDSQKRLAKDAVFDKAMDDYDALKQTWHGYNGYDAWMQRGLNNARLSSLATYDDLVPAFQALLCQVDGDLPTFYAEVKALGVLSAEERMTRLQFLLAGFESALN